MKKLILLFAILASVACEKEETCSTLVDHGQNEDGEWYYNFSNGDMFLNTNRVCVDDNTTICNFIDLTFRNCIVPTPANN